MKPKNNEQEMITIQNKMQVGMILCIAFFSVATGLKGATADGILPPPPATLSEPNILYAIYGQLWNNPSSLFVIGFLGVICWLMDDLPFVNSRYCQHYSVLIGMCTFWMFTSADTVPEYFPHPIAVLIVNGMLAGFIAFHAHRWVISKLISFIKSKTSDEKEQSEKHV
jgi:hypothetical protein